MKNKFDSNSFEHDYILGCIESFVVDMKTDKELTQMIDKVAVQITAFMNGQLSKVIDDATALSKHQLISHLGVQGISARCQCKECAIARKYAYLKGGHPMKCFICGNEDWYEFTDCCETCWEGK